ncbi:MAG: hypothetical protein ACRCXT_00455 [Paraclostridium sp.]
MDSNSAIKMSPSEMVLRDVSSMMQSYQFASSLKNISNMIAASQAYDIQSGLQAFSNIDPSEQVSDEAKNSFFKKYTPEMVQYLAQTGRLDRSTYVSYISFLDESERKKIYDYYRLVGGEAFSRLPINSTTDEEAQIISELIGVIPNDIIFELYAERTGKNPSNFIVEVNHIVSEYKDVVTAANAVFSDVQMNNKDAYMKKIDSSIKRIDFFLNRGDPTLGGAKDVNVISSSFYFKSLYGNKNLISQRMKHDLLEIRNRLIARKNQIKT